MIYLFKYLFIYENTGAALPLGGKALGLYTEVCDKYSDKDFSVVYKHISDIQSDNKKSG